MSIYGAMFSGVSGLIAQSQAMGMISDNISNVNTVGYKGSKAQFQTLVTLAASASNYTPGGVLSTPFQRVDNQGLVQSSTSPTDIAVSGRGLFVVTNNAAPAANDPTYYTRAGSFYPDKNGFLVNTAGYYLRGWETSALGVPLNSNPNSLAGLETVMITGVTGSAVATSNASVVINLNASQTIFAGPSLTTLSSLNVGANAALVPPLVNGNQFSITNGAVNATFTVGAGAGQFDTLTELAALINAVTGLSATIGGTTTAATLTVTGANETAAITIANVTGTPATTLWGATLTAGSTYDPAVTTKNMAGGGVTPHYMRTIQVYDALGATHDIALAFLKTAANTWAVEVYASPASAITTAQGLVAYGNMVFNGDATINSISPALTAALSFPWTNGATASTVTLDLGSQGAVGVALPDGITQFDSDYATTAVTQDGVQFGRFTGVNITAEGLVYALFDNGQSRPIFKIPVATFMNPNGLEAKTGNVYAQTGDSGGFILNSANSGGAGKIVPSALEASNVDMATEFTSMIITQRAYSAAAKIITTADEMLDELIRIKR